MGSNNSYFGAIVLVVIIAFVATAGQAALAEGSTTTAVGNEPVAVDYDQNSSVDEDGLSYNASANVRNETGAALAAGTDYEWNTTTGSISWNPSADTTDGGTAYVDYAVTQATEVSLGVSQIVAVLLVAVGILAMWIVGSKAIGGLL